MLFPYYKSHSPVKLAKKYPNLKELDIKKHNFYLCNGNVFLRLHFELLQDGELKNLCLLPGFSI